MLKAILGALGFTARVHDHDAQRAAFDRKFSGLPKDAREGLRYLKGLDDEDRPNVTGSIAGGRYQGRFEKEGKVVPPDVWWDGLKQDLQPIADDFRSEWKAFKDYCK